MPSVFFHSGLSKLYSPFSKQLLHAPCKHRNDPSSKIDNMSSPYLFHKETMSFEVSDVRRIANNYTVYPNNSYSPYTITNIFTSKSHVIHKCFGYSKRMLVWVERTYIWISSMKNIFGTR